MTSFSRKKVGCLLTTCIRLLPSLLISQPSESQQWMRKLTPGIFYGRPFGGVATLVNNKYLNSVNHVTCNERFVVVMIDSVVFINVYFPCKQSDRIKSIEALNIVNNMIDEITGLLHTLSYDYIIFGGDLNANLNVSCTLTDAIQGLANSFDLSICSNVATPAVDYTFHTMSTGHKSMIDWLLVSDALQPSVLALNILELGLNISDHLPVVLEISLQLSEVVNNNNKNDSADKIPRLKWNNADLTDYYDLTRQLLQPSYDVFSGMYNKLFNNVAMNSANSICCTDDLSDLGVIRRIAIHLIDKYYPLLVSNLDFAANESVPRGRVREFDAKHWWSADLDDAKARSIESHRLWIDNDKPRFGPIFEVYRKEKYSYKLAIRQARLGAADTISNDLHEALSNKDNDQFWKIWNSNMGTAKNQARMVGGLVDSHEIAESFAKHFSEVCKPNNIKVNERMQAEFQNKIVNYKGTLINESDFFSCRIDLQNNM